MPGVRRNGVVYFADAPQLGGNLAGKGLPRVWLPAIHD